MEVLQKVTTMRRPARGGVTVQEQLAAFAVAEPRIIACYLFGSRARGEVTATSDVDAAEANCRGSVAGGRADRISASQAARESHAKPQRHISSLEIPAIFRRCRRSPALSDRLAWTGIDSRTSESCFI